MKHPAKPGPKLPREVLISTLQEHQRYFALENAEGKLLPWFITISNIDSPEPALIRAGNERVVRPRLADAQFFIAHTVGFASWPKFARHLAGLERVNSPVSKFEAAVNAIVSGDFAALDKLLRESPELVRARSTRKHRSTLLHYVSANGVEDFRQHYG